MEDLIGIDFVEAQHLRQRNAESTPKCSIAGTSEKIHVLNWFASEKWKVSRSFWGPKPIVSTICGNISWMWPEKVLNLSLGALHPQVAPCPEMFFANVLKVRPRSFGNKTTHHCTTITITPHLIDPFWMGMFMALVSSNSAGLLVNWCHRLPGFVRSKMKYSIWNLKPPIIILGVAIYIYISINTKYQYYHIHIYYIYITCVYIYIYTLCIYIYYVYIYTLCIYIYIHYVYIYIYTLCVYKYIYIHIYIYVCIYIYIHCIYIYIHPWYIIIYLYIHLMYMYIYIHCTLYIYIPMPICWLTWALSNQVAAKYAARVGSCGMGQKSSADHGVDHGLVG